MPYFTREYCEKLVGKTVEQITPNFDNNSHSITIFWSDGTNTRISACVEHEKPPEREITLIVNTCKMTYGS